MSSRLLKAVEAENIAIANGRFTSGKRAAMIAWEGADPLASPAPIRNRHAASCHPLDTQPVIAVITLQKANPTAMMLRRLERSATLAIGTPSRELKRANARPEISPSAVSDKARSALIRGRTSPSKERSRKLNMDMRVRKPRVQASAGFQRSLVPDTSEPLASTMYLLVGFLCRWRRHRVPILG